MAENAFNVAMLTILEFAYKDYMKRLDNYYFLSRRIRMMIKEKKDEEILETYRRLKKVEGKPFRYKLDKVVYYLSNVAPKKIMLQIAVPVEERTYIEKDRLDFYVRVFRNKPFNERKEIIKNYLIRGDNWKLVNECFSLGSYFEKNIDNLKKYYLFDNYKKYVKEHNLLKEGEE